MISVIAHHGQKGLQAGRGAVVGSRLQAQYARHHLIQFQIAERGQGKCTIHATPLRLLLYAAVVERGAARQEDGAHIWFVVVVAVRARLRPRIAARLDGPMLYKMLV